MEGAPACGSLDEPAQAAVSRMRDDDLAALALCDRNGTYRSMLYMPSAATRLAELESSDARAGDLGVPMNALDSGDSLGDALASFEAQRTGILPVVHGGGVVGVIGLDLVEQGLETDRELGDLAGQVSKDVAPGDRMYPLGKTWSSYLWVGASALGCIRRSLRAAGKEEVRSILDFGCGHGRVLRVLKVAFPQAELTGSDANEDGVAFCARLLGCTPVVSHEDPAQVELEGSFDLIWSGSVLTHLDADRWDGFLDLLESVLAPDGVLVFTSVGAFGANAFRSGVSDPDLSEEGIEQILCGYDESGFGYSNYVDREDWGDAIVKPEWIHGLFERRGTLRVIDYQEAAWANTQDVITLTHPRAGA